MSDRYTWTVARETGFYLESSGTEIGDGNVAEGEVALVLGPVGGGDMYVLEGGREEIARLLAGALLYLLEYYSEFDLEDEHAGRPIQDVVVADERL
jgi:hypothetical protein